MKETRFAVPTRVLISQAQAIASQLAAPANAGRVSALGSFGVDVVKFKPELESALAELVQAKSDQERTKGDYLSEAKADQSMVEQGYRWKQRLDARVRVYIAEHGDAEDLAGQFRFGKLTSARGRGVLNELRIAIPEATEHQAKLAPFGVSPAFLAEGQKIADALGGNRESDAVLADRKAKTKVVATAELRVSRLLDRLRKADEACATEEPGEAPLFRLDLIRAQVARVKALREAAQAAGGDGADDGE
jgi:hypothetical protein